MSKVLTAAFRLLDKVIGVSSDGYAAVFRGAKRAALVFRSYRCLVLLLVFLLTGSARALKGHVTHHRHRQSGEAYGGAQPVSGSHLYLFAINTAGYESAPISLLHGSGVSMDAAGNGYLTTGEGGGFNLTGLYEAYCPTPGSSVYLQAIGGDPGDGDNNSAIDLIAVVPLTCSQFPNASDIGLDESTTVAGAWALARYASASSSSFSASSGNPQALLNAVTYANNMVSSYTIEIQNTAYSGSLTVPVPTINTMADIIADCVDSGASSTACTQLFTYAAPVGGVMPTDTFQAAVDIALNPSNNVANIFSLLSSGDAPFQPTLSTAPSSWAITYGISPSIGAQQRVVTLNHNQVQNTDQTNFPVAVSTNVNPMLMNLSSGGLVQSPYGYDVLFTSDAAGQNMLDYEIDNYNPSTGAATFWVRIPRLSASIDTPIYMWFGIPNISNSLENTLGVWSNNYLSVYHFGNGPNLDIKDSALAGYNLLGTATLAQGQFGGAASFSSNSTNYLYYNNVIAYPTGSSPVTFEAWEKGAVGSDLVGYGGNWYPNQQLGIVSSSPVWGLYANGFGIYSYLGTPDANWHQMVGVFGGGDLSAPLSQIYFDGQNSSEGYSSGPINLVTDQLTIGQYPATTCCTLTGVVDEVRISSVPRSADWISTEFNNQSAPASFGVISPALLYPSSSLLSSSANPTAVGQAVVLSATVIGQTANSGVIVPTGSVTFYDGATNLGVGTVNASGIATLSTSTLAVGSHSMTAVYAGDSNYAGSTSSALTETVTAVYTSAISCVPSTITSGENVTCVVTLQAGAMSPVSFSVGGSSWTSATPDATGSVVANAVLSEGTPGTYTISYLYPGDPGIPGVSNSTQITVNSAGTQPSGSGIYSFSITDQSGNSGYAANGNINAYTDSVNGVWSMGYDTLNRLTSSTQSLGGAAQYGCWSYDSFGNMLTQGVSNQQFSNTTTACQAQPGAITLQSNLHYNNANQIDPNPNDPPSTWLDASKNTHTGTPVYDAAGEITNDLLNQYLYNPQGQVCAVQMGPGAYIGYLYDAEGHRVAKGNLSSLTCDPAALQVTATYFIGPDGGTMTEMSSSTGWVRTEVSAAGMHVATYTPSGVHYPLSDWLGTKRLTVNPSLVTTTNPNGVEESCSSWPFGDQQICSTSLDASPNHFTGKERDTESGLDYFGARYYGSSMGRFMSPDPVFISAQRLADPQSLNLYAYVRNNPLGLTDDTGLDFYLACATSDHSGCGQVQNGSSSVWVQGQTVNGSFQATDVDMNQQGDTSAGYHDQFGNQYTGTFDQNNGVSFTDANGNTSSHSQFIDGSDNTQLNGSGAFANITGNFFSDCGGSCQGRAALSGSAAAFAATESQLNKQGGLTTALDRLSGAHKGGAQWKDSNGYVHMLQSPSGQMEMHFEGHPTGVDVQQFVLHMVDTIRDATSGRANQEKNATLPQ